MFLLDGSCLLWQMLQYVWTAQAAQASTVTLLNWLSSQDDVVIQVRSYDWDILQLF